MSNGRVCYRAVRAFYTMAARDATIDLVTASVPLTAMWLLAGVIHSGNGYREPKKARVLKTETFTELFKQLPWKSVNVWQDGRYQYAVCEKR